MITAITSEPPGAATPTTAPHAIPIAELITVPIAEAITTAILITVPTEEILHRGAPITVGVPVVQARISESTWRRLLLEMLEWDSDSDSDSDSEIVVPRRTASWWSRWWARARRAAR